MVVSVLLGLGGGEPYLKPSWGPGAFQPLAHRKDAQVLTCALYRFSLVIRSKQPAPRRPPPPPSGPFLLGCPLLMGPVPPPSLVAGFHRAELDPWQRSGRGPHPGGIKRQQRLSCPLSRVPPAFHLGAHICDQNQTSCVSETMGRVSP